MDLDTIIPISRIFIFSCCNIAISFDVTSTNFRLSVYIIYLKSIFLFINNKKYWYVYWRFFLQFNLILSLWKFVMSLQLNMTYLFFYVKSVSYFDLCNESYCGFQLINSNDIFNMIGAAQKRIENKNFEEQIKWFYSPIWSKH